MSAREDYWRLIERYYACLDLPGLSRAEALAPIVKEMDAIWRRLTPGDQAKLMERMKKLYEERIG